MSTRRASTRRPERSGERLPVPRSAADRLQRLVQDRRLRPGDRLPAQRELADLLGISRASLREALSALETLGLVSVEAGRGVFVAEPSERGMWRFADRGSPRDVYEARRCLEGFAAGLAAQRADPETLTAIRGSVVALRGACERGDIEAMAAADSEFHDAIIATCANPILAAMYKSVREMMVESQRLPMLTRMNLEKTVAEHESLLAALERGDADGAAAEMQHHIRSAAARLGVAI